MQKESKQRRLIEDSIPELMNWIREHSQDIADPVKASLEARNLHLKEPQIPVDSSGVTFDHSLRRKNIHF